MRLIDNQYFIELLAWSRVGADWILFEYRCCKVVCCLRHMYLHENVLAFGLLPFDCLIVFLLVVISDI